MNILKSMFKNGPSILCVLFSFLVNAYGAQEIDAGQGFNEGTFPPIVLGLLLTGIPLSILILLVWLIKRTPPPERSLFILSLLYLKSPTMRPYSLFLGLLLNILFLIRTILSTHTNSSEGKIPSVFKKVAYFLVGSTGLCIAYAQAFPLRVVLSFFLPLVFFFFPKAGLWPMVPAYIKTAFGVVPLWISASFVFFFGASLLWSLKTKTQKAKILTWNLGFLMPHMLVHFLGAIVPQNLHLSRNIVLPLYTLLDVMYLVFYTRWRCRNGLSLPWPKTKLIFVPIAVLSFFVLGNALNFFLHGPSPSSF